MPPFKCVARLQGLQKAALRSTLSDVVGGLAHCGSLSNVWTKRTRAAGFAYFFPSALGQRCVALTSEAGI